jgi:putative endonuclease
LQSLLGVGSVGTVNFGILGENLACETLQRRGYAILARRYRTRVGEIDIVAADGDTIVFVEVKARRDTRCGVPAESVTWWKQRRIVTMARFYLATHRCQHRPARFDVVSVLAPRGAAPTVEIIRGAFTADRW